MEMIKLSVAVIFHPLDTFYLVKYNRNKLNYFPAIILLMFVMVVRVSYLYILHFPLAALEPKDTSIWMEMLKMAGPIVTWIIACYAVTSILEGESYVTEIATGSTFAMIPYIVFSIPVSIISLLLGQGEAGFYNTIQCLLWVWVVILFIISVKALNDYSFIQTIGICLLSIFAMFLIWAIIILVFALTNQLWKFIEGIAREAKWFQK